MPKKLKQSEAESEAAIDKKAIAKSGHARGKALQLWNRFEDTIGRERLIPVLEGSLDVRFQKLLKELSCPLPALNNLSIRRLAARNGISYNELVEAYRQTNLGEVIIKMSEGMREVAEDTLEDARSYTLTCKNCDGTGRVMKAMGDGEVEVQCRECGGEGKVRKLGDMDSRKLVFEAVGLTKRGGGVQLNQNFVNFKGEADESLEALVRETDKVIDGTVIEVSSQEETKDEATS